MSMQRFANKVALVTGGASGIGKACAVAFAREGARVTVVDLNVSSGHETVEEIRDSGGAALFLRADVSEPAAVERMVADSLMAFGRLDFAVHSAQIGVEPIATVDEWRRVIDVNLNGVFLSMRCEVTQMVKQGGGSIVNVVTIPKKTCKFYIEIYVNFIPFIIYY